MVEKEAAENLDQRDAELLTNLDATPMFVSEDMRKDVRSRDNMKKAKKQHQKRSKRSRSVDNSKDAGKIFEEPLRDEELDLWSENKNEFDIEGIDTKDDSLFL